MQPRRKWKPTLRTMTREGTVEKRKAVILLMLELTMPLAPRDVRKAIGNSIRSPYIGPTIISWNHLFTYNVRDMDSYLRYVEAVSAVTGEDSYTTMLRLPIIFVAKFSSKQAHADLDEAAYKWLDL